jgi:fructosamine-3-kinase
MHPLARAASRLLGEEVADCMALHGGDLSDVVRIVTASGRTLIGKSGPDPAAEAAMLSAIRASGACAPAPVAADANVLLLEDLGPAASPSAASWRHLGENLRRLHSAVGGDYGWDADHAFGPVIIRNGRCPEWPEFWRTPCAACGHASRRSFPRRLPRPFCTAISGPGTSISTAGERPG